ncbi:hypothetical protein KUCAC02_002309, partial [Chaenocephalus aceratus]
SERRQGASALVTERMFTASRCRSRAGGEGGLGGGVRPGGASHCRNTSLSQPGRQIENIDACLSFLAAKGVNIQGLSSEEIRNAPGRPPPPEPAEQCPGPAQPLYAWDCCPRSPDSSTGRDAVQPSLTRVSTAGGDIPTRGSVSAAGNRRSQGFSDKTKANLNKAHRSPSALNEGQCAVQFQGLAQGCTGWVISDHQLLHQHPRCYLRPDSSPSSSSSSSSSTAIPQPNSNSKPWRSKSVSSKHISTSSSSISTAASAMQSAKQDKDSSCKADAPPKVVAQKSMLEKLKLFNSKGSSKSRLRLQWSSGAVGEVRNCLQHRPPGGSRWQRPARNERDQQRDGLRSSSISSSNCLHNRQQPQNGPEGSPSALSAEL